MEGESCIKRSIIDEISCLDIQLEQNEGEGGVTRIIIDEVHSSDMVKWKVKVVLPEVSLMNFILRISKRIKWKAKLVLLEVSVMNFILRIWSNGR